MKNFISFTVLALGLLPSPIFAQSIAQGIPTDTTPQLREKIEPTKIKEPVDDDKASENKDDSDSDKANSIDLKSLGRKKDKSTVPLPLRMASFTTGFVVGTPIAITRCAIKQTKAGTRDLVGDSHNPLLVVPAAIISIPFGAMGGPFEGVGYAAVNSWRHSGDEPFGQETFSLGDSID